jgi:hypothetical protein
VLIPEVVFWWMASVALSATSMAGSISVFWAALRATRPDLPPVAVWAPAWSAGEFRS